VSILVVLDKVKLISDEISARSSVIKEAARKLKESGAATIYKSTKIKLDLSVASTDGGVISSRMHGVDMVLFRSVGVCFTYLNSSLASFSYFPEKYPPSQLECATSLDEHEALVFKSLLRLKSELSIAIETIERFLPHVFLFDGSLLPLPNDRPNKESKIYPLYLEVISLYSKLFSLSTEKKCLLCGVIKDSRSNRLAKSHSIDSSDTVLCNFLLQEGERTADLSYGEADKQIEGYQNVRFFYIKPSKNDLPLRIEYLSSEEITIETVSSLLYSLSSINDSFGYPAILVEAEMCAAMDGKEMEHILQSLRSNEISDLRRNSRPFR
jgi:hypothetical protein